MGYVLHQCVIISVFSIISLFSGPIIQKLGARDCITKGVSLSGLSALGMVLVGLLAPKSPYLMTFFMSLGGLGAAVSYPVIFAGSLEIFPDIKGAASSVIMSMRSFLCFAFVALTSYLYNGNPLRIALIVLGGNIICLFLTPNLLRHEPFSGVTSPQNAS